MNTDRNAQIKPRGLRRVLILASKMGYQTRGFADAAEKLGVAVVFGTDRCHQLDDPWGDEALPLHFENPREAAVEIARALSGGTGGDRERGENLVSAVIALGDRPTPTAAYAAQLLGVAANPPEAAEICRNKLRQREALRAAGIRVPDFFAFAAADDLNEVLRRATFPCVVKPLSLAASQGVIRANSVEEFETAVRRIQLLLESPEIQVTRDPELDRLLVESYIPGREVALEGLMTRGNLRVLAIFDKPDPLEGPYFEESIYVTPSRLPAQTQAAIAACASDTVRALGLETGPVHAEFRVNEAGPWVLEVAPRPIGGLCSRALRFGPERISLEELLLRDALGFPGSDLVREELASGVMMIPVPRSGIFEGVDGLEEAEKIAGVTEIRTTARLRDYVAAWPEGASYLGFIFARGESAAFVEDVLRAAHARLEFRFSPRLSVEHPATGKMAG
ncbi:MAG: ATP-grasp domain-containing protein [Candidatus Acidiferrales bacterium]